MKKAAVIGATGFGGLGLFEILLKHPELEITQAFARKDIGLKISDVFPHLEGYAGITVKDTSEIDYSSIDIAFFSTPDRAGMNLIKDFHDRKIKVIDYSGDFRFTSLSDYEIYAKNKSMDTTHSSDNLLAGAVYGLPEKFREKIKKASIVGNPGCFAISMILGILPLAEKGLIASETIIVDGKSGVSGAGKSPGEANFYPQRYENINTYREGKHQHLVEVENTVNQFSKNKIKVLFIPQVIPMTRGILNNIYCDINVKISTDDLLSLYRDYYVNEPFVKITGKSPNTSDVRGSNRCLIRPMVDSRTSKVLVTSVIDNLMKGQSGNAVQLANLMLGFDETSGLSFPGFYP